MSDFDLHLLTTGPYHEQLVAGFWLSIKLAAGTLVLAMPLALLVALLRMTPSRWLSGIGFTFVPLSTIAFSTLAPRYRNEGTALFSLSRNIGSSIGISVVMTYLARCAQGNHASFADYINPSNLALRQAVAVREGGASAAAGHSCTQRAVPRGAARPAVSGDGRPGVGARRPLARLEQLYGRE